MTASAARMPFSPPSLPDAYAASALLHRYTAKKRSGFHSRSMRKPALASMPSHHGIAPKVYAQVAGNEAILTLVSLGLGAGVLPSVVAQSSPLRDKVMVRPLDPPLEPYVVGVCALSHRLSLPIVRAFWDNAALPVSRARTR